MLEGQVGNLAPRKPVYNRRSRSKPKQPHIACAVILECCSKFPLEGLLQHVGGMPLYLNGNAPPADRVWIAARCPRLSAPLRP